MAEALKKAVDDTHAAREKVNAEANAKVAKHGGFTKKFKELDKIRTEKDFDKKKKECNPLLKAAVDAATAQWKSTLEWETKIKAAKEKLAEEQKAIAEFKKQWNEKIAKAEAHNHIVEQLNPPGPERDKLMHKVPETVSRWIEQIEREHVHYQHDLNEEDSAMKASKELQKLDRETLEKNDEALTNKKFSGKGK